MEISESDIDKFIQLDQFNALSSDNQFNLIVWAGSLISYMKNLLPFATVSCKVNTRKRRQHVSINRISHSISIKNHKLVFHVSIKSKIGFSNFDQYVINTIIALFKMSSEECINFKESDLAYTFYDNLETLIISSSIAYFADENWGESDISNSRINEILFFLKRLANNDYEGRKPQMIVSLLPYFNNRSSPDYNVEIGRHLLNTKKTSVLFSGHRHLVECTSAGVIRKVVSLKPYKDVDLLEDGQNLYVAPYEYQPVFNYSKKNNALVFILNRYGDISVLLDGILLLEKNRCGWRSFSVENFFQNIKNQLENISEAPSNDIFTFSIYLSMICLTLRHQKKGGLILISSQKALDNIVRQSKNNSDGIDELYGSLFNNTHVGNTAVSLICNMVSIDGATLITDRGIIISFGTIINTHHYKSNSEGSRTKAAEYASKFGLVIKISEDGPVTLYKNRKILREL